MNNIIEKLGITDLTKKEEGSLLKFIANYHDSVSALNVLEGTTLRGATGTLRIIKARSIRAIEIILDKEFKEIKELLL